MSFLVTALDGDQFKHYFSMNDQQLQTHRAIRETVSAYPGTPCRVSLKDAQIGEEVVLLNFEHQKANTPFRASHAIYVRESADQFRAEPNQVPSLLMERTLSIRAFNDSHWMIDAEIATGLKIQETITKLFTNDNVSYLQLHTAHLGCFLAGVDRSG